MSAAVNVVSVRFLCCKVNTFSFLSSVPQSPAHTQGQRIELLEGESAELLKPQHARAGLQAREGLGPARRLAGDLG